jgi:cytochrome c-type biogenesis protein CcmH
MLVWLLAWALPAPAQQAVPPSAAPQAALPSPAPQALPMADDPVLEAEVLRIAHELRCLVCQNETIAASNADLAVDLRAQIRSQLKAGRSEREILDYMVARYGDFVLYRPPLKPTTWLLWGGPFVLLAAMAWWLARTLRRRRQEVAAAQAPLSDEERRRARALLGGSTGPAGE